MITLMYHGITSKDVAGLAGREAGAEFYDVPLDRFRAQMQWLKNSGSKAVITFDDGEMSNYTLAFPVLKELGLKAYFFIIVKRIGKDGYMGWKELKELAQEGMFVGSHGLTHEILTNLKDSQAEEELLASKKCLEINLGASVNSFSVPRGFCNAKIIRMARELYTEVYISEMPEDGKLDATPRIAVKSNWTLKRFQQAVKGYVPPGEIIRDAFKNTAKIILREKGYNVLRRALIFLVK